jgi:ATP-dependent NAD(P)H-hydrate dehydratase
MNFPALIALVLDLVHIFCPQSAALPIKSYSPELIVHPLLDSDNALDLIEPWLSRLHVIVIGSGLGRDRNILHTVSEIIMCCKKSQKPLVIDADGLFLITQNVSLIADYKNVILTPNAMELFRLIGDSNDKLQALAEKVGPNATVMEKAQHDRIYDLEQMVKVECPTGGSNRRCGGQGDLLAGALATLFHWSLNFQPKDNSGAIENNEHSAAVLACYASSLLIKHCNKLAYKIHGRSMTAQDMISLIHVAFTDLKLETNNEQEEKM